MFRFACDPTFAAIAPHNMPRSTMHTIITRRGPAWAEYMGVRVSINCRMGILARNPSATHRMPTTNAPNAPYHYFLDPINHAPLKPWRRIVMADSTRCPWRGSFNGR